ncbi:MAG: helix-turn-helix domain-containing protein [Cellvibrionaceae bacterium]
MKQKKVAHSSTVLSVWLRPLMDYLTLKGHDSNAIFNDAGIDSKTLLVPSARIPLAKAAPLWKTAAELTNEPFIGIEIYHQAVTMQADTVAIAMMSSRNLYEALQRMTRLLHIICDGVDALMFRHDAVIRIDFQICTADIDVMPLESLDPAFLIILNLIKQGVAHSDAILYVGFQRPAPDVTQHQRITSLLGVDAKFDCDNYHVCIDWHAAQIQNPYWNPALADSSEALALKDLQLLEESNLIHRVKQLILKQLSLGTPQQESIASILNISTRQLQRRLSAQGVSFGELLQQTRQAQAHEFLKDPNMAVVDVGLSLGFQDQSNFTKAFKKWTNETPKQYRQRILR